MVTPSPYSTGFPPRPLPGRYPHGPVYGMVPAKEHTRGRLPGPAFPVLVPLLGISRLLPPPMGAGEERRRRGRGGGDRRTVHGMQENSVQGRPPGCALPGLFPREPPLLRGNLMGGPVWFSFPGKGFPPRPPPLDDFLHDPVYGMVWEEGGVCAGIPGRPFRGYHDYYLFLWGGG